MLGKLSLDAIPYHNPIIMGAGVFMALTACTIVGSLLYFKKLGYLWREWLTSVDHKKIGVMYIVLAFIMLFRGFADAIMMRLQQALAVGHSYGYLPPDHFDQVFTAHGVIMIFFMAMPFMSGLINVVVPLQIGARDVAYPYLNSLSLWLTIIAAGLVNISLVVGKFAATGWLAYPPLSEIAYSPGVGVDYYLWALQIAGVGTLLSGINFFVTILKMRCPGMTLMKMPIFCWTALCSMTLVILAFPVLTATFAMLFLDRYLGMHFFTLTAGGNAMMYINLIWAWGHPEVYILILPAFGIFSEVVATFSKKSLFGYNTMVYATIAITFLAFIVWLHHFFTMGAGANVNAFFGIATMIISVPTGVKVFNWLFTMYRGKITFSTPMLWSIGFMITFAVGGMSGVLMSIPGVDFQLHNSLFLVAHFHNVIIGGVVFGYFAGMIYWFPKAFGFKLNETLGRYAFGFWTVGFYIAFMPLYILGLMGMTRRMDHYPAWTGWHPYLVIALIGVVFIAIGIAFQVLQIIDAVIHRHDYRDTTGDPWDGRTLEWSTSSPPPFYNFAKVPTVTGRDPFWARKQKELDEPATSKVAQTNEPIVMPRNTATGVVIGVFSGILGFSMVWHIIGLACIGLVGVMITVIARTFNSDIEYIVHSDEINIIEANRLSEAV